MPLHNSQLMVRGVFIIALMCLSDVAVFGQRAYPSIALPPARLSLDDLAAFRQTGTNWKIVGNVFADIHKEQVLTGTGGKGVLANLSDEKNRGHLFTKLEHGDIEIEMDVMMAKGSNSGIYLQGRYEVQLFDSWGKKDSKYSYMGGIYQRTDTASNKGYGGSAPLLNACKAPGLWQTLKVIFKAPSFDAGGRKIADARFVKIWLNGVLVQDSVSVSGPTRSAAFKDEKPTGPLMFQGNHGRVAFRNIRYKAYDGGTVKTENLVYREFKTPGESIRHLPALEKVAERRVDSISRHLATQPDVYLMSYEGSLKFPRAGLYLFTLQTGGGGILIINRDTVIMHGGANGFDQEAKAVYKAHSGSVRFTLIYNKPVQHRHGLAWYVEGPGIATHALHASGSPFVESPVAPLIIPMADGKAVIQRSFMTSGEGKRTHCISVGTSTGIHYTVDLEQGNLFQIWDGGFLDATPMWHRRGNGQVAIPLGPKVLFPPAHLIYRERFPVNMVFREYTLDARGMPEFVYSAGGLKVSDKLVPSEDGRALTRRLFLEHADNAECQLAKGTVIERLNDRTFIVNDKEYYLLLNTAGLSAEIRRVGASDVIVVSGGSAGRLDIEYTLLW